jgi:hypothetical protein
VLAAKRGHANLSNTYVCLGHEKLSKLDLLVNWFNDSLF